MVQKRQSISYQKETALNLIFILVQLKNERKNERKIERKIVHLSLPSRHMTSKTQLSTSI